jgi:hypothetical protein
MGDHEIIFEVLAAAGVGRLEGLAEFFEAPPVSLFISRRTFFETCSGAIFNSPETCWPTSSRMFSRFPGQVIADAAADEDLFHPGNFAGLAEERNQPVVGRTKGAVEAGFAAARVAIHAVHVGRRPTEVVNVSLEVGMADEAPDFGQDRSLGPGNDRFALVQGQRTKGTAAEATRWVVTENWAIRNSGKSGGISREYGSP